jgi:MraZ protein
MAYFVGEFETTVDTKHRLAISSEFREQINPDDDGQNFVLTLGTRRHLWLYPDRYHRQLLKNLKRSPLPSKHGTDLTIFFGTARIVRADNQGRIVLPDKSLKRSNISERVTVVGNDDHLEIWPRDEWDKLVTDALEHYDEIITQASDETEALQDEKK